VDNLRVNTSRVFLVVIHSFLLVGARDGRTQFARACLFFFPSPQTHPPKNLKIWSLIPSDIVKSPSFFKPRGTHKGPKQPFFFFFFLNFVMKILWNVANENIHGEASFYYYYYYLCVFCFYFCVYFHFYIIFLFKKKANT
jgi:RsiW-degrading membrane proteinase PrsW (M82 family)